MRRGSSALLALAVAPLLAHARVAGDWHGRLDWQGRSASMRRDGAGFLLSEGRGTRAIPPAPWRVETASVLFDGLFAMAQQDLRRDAVSEITDSAWNHGKPVPCHCFVAGKQWPFVWTRDLSYSTDLALWRFDPDRARNSLAFKVSGVRDNRAPQGLYVLQDTGSGGSWPISTDRVVWFLGARHLLQAPAFAELTWKALRDTLAQDRTYAFDPDIGLYRGETSFMDWREQTYPGWTARNVRFIASSFALSTNVLHYEALRLAVQLAQRRGHTAIATHYARQADALKAAINRWFWNPGRGLYRSYLGGGNPPLPVDAYDLLGTSLAIVSGVADGKRARLALNDYPSWPAGTPVIWPERASQPVYHNRAMWPFVSAYALRAARRIQNPARIAHELRSLIRAAALSGSNMENFALPQLDTKLPGKLGGPVVDSRRQLWSVAGYLNMVVEGVFGLENNGRIRPEIPVSLVPMLFGAHPSISLRMPGQVITLVRPAKMAGNLLVADAGAPREGQSVRIQLKAITAISTPLHAPLPSFAPATPAPAHVVQEGHAWIVRSTVPATLWVDGRIQSDKVARIWRLPVDGLRHCVNLTTVAHGVQSLPSRPACMGPTDRIGGAWPRTWTAPRTGEYVLRLEFDNANGPINTGITAAVRRIAIQCGAPPARTGPLIMPQGHGLQRSSRVRFHAAAGARCEFRLLPGFNMSYLSQAALFTGGAGGASGPLNEARIDALLISPTPPATRPTATHGAP